MALPDTLRADALTGTAVALGVVLLGAPLGLLWAALAPRPQVRIVSRDSVSYLDPEPRAFLGADLSFLLIGLVVGALVGLLAWRLAGRRAPGVVVGLVLGGLLASWIAARTGARVGRPEFLAALRAGRPAIVGQSPSLLAQQCLVGLPLGALATFVALFWTRTQSVGPDQADQADQADDPDQADEPEVARFTPQTDVWATP